jgi:hypothetical protein
MVDKNTPIFFAAVLKALKGDLKELGRLWFSAKSREGQTFPPLS